MLRGPIRTLQAGDEQELLALCRADPVANVFLAGRVESQGCDPARLGGQIWGYFSRGHLMSACWAGANLVPVQATEAAASAFAAKARRAARRAVSIVGPADPVLSMWDRLAPHWGVAREVRRDQPLMVINTPARVPGDPTVRLASMADFEAIVPAAVSMFTEEVGYSPIGHDGGLVYRQRVAELVGGQRTYASFTDFATAGERRVIFKADLGSISRDAVQIQGVWVNPEYRGRGLSVSGMATVVQQCQARGMQQVSLYVNAYNVRAVRAYEHVGFRQVGTFATVLF